MIDTTHVEHMLDLVRRHASPEGQAAVERAAALLLQAFRTLADEMALLKAERDSLLRMVRAVSAQASADQEAAAAAGAAGDETAATIRRQQLQIAELESTLNRLSSRLAGALDRAVLAEFQATTLTDELVRARRSAAARAQIHDYLTRTREPAEAN